MIVILPQLRWADNVRCCSEACTRGIGVPENTRLQPGASKAWSR
jgi:hypothetical protein